MPLNGVSIKGAVQGRTVDAKQDGIGTTLTREPHQN